MSIVHRKFMDVGTNILERILANEQVQEIEKEGEVEDTGQVHDGRG